MKNLNCTCSKCSLYISTDEINNVRVRGRFIKESICNKHKDLDSKGLVISIKLTSKEKKSYNVKTLGQEKSWVKDVYGKSASLILLENYKIQYSRNGIPFNPLDPTFLSSSNSPQPIQAESSTSSDSFHNKNKEEQINYLYDIIQYLQEEVISLKRRFEQMEKGPMVVNVEDESPIERPNKRPKSIKNKRLNK
jgi:hypothetical protein